MKPLKTSILARSIAALGFALMAVAAQAQMQTPPPNVPPSARPVAKPTPPLLPSRAAPSPPASSPELSPTATATSPQTPTQLGQPQVNIPLGKPAEAAAPSTGPLAAVPPPPAASRSKMRPARKPTPSAAACEKLTSASARIGCLDGRAPSTR